MKIPRSTAHFDPKMAALRPYFSHFYTIILLKSIYYLGRPYGLASKPPHAIYLAQRFQQPLRFDKVNNQAELARIHGITRACVTQIMNLLKLLLAIRTQIVQMPPDEQEYFNDKKLRKVVRLQYASEQLEAFEALKSKYNG